MSLNASTRAGRREVVRWGLICLTAFAIAGCEMAGSSADEMLGDLPGIVPADSQDVVASEEGDAADPVIAAGVQVDEASAAAIRDAAIAYVRQETAIDDVAVEIDAVSDGWARVRVFPSGSSTDPATLYLREEGSAWRGIVIGTAFAPPDLDDMGIPTSVRP